MYRNNLGRRDNVIIFLFSLLDFFLKDEFTLDIINLNKDGLLNPDQFLVHEMPIEFLYRLN